MIQIKFWKFVMTKEIIQNKNYCKDLFYYSLLQKAYILAMLLMTLTNILKICFYIKCQYIFYLHMFQFYY